ncbi:hypothetical protein SLEP1_g14665 [Rubroshorea leprosula]|uniref:Secreted protein n=1 Tax=Rubroshorea leprosula TaxID=152421 RepID=A0AAV5ITQ1_9ROSI|nr:hypothetical protein SLEP1_g14665 [Rubroshorea leprosula]
MPASTLPLALRLAPVLVSALVLRDAALHASWTLDTPPVCPWLQLRATMPSTSAPELACRDMPLPFSSGCLPPLLF